MSDSLEFPYEELYYLKARGPEEKSPAEEWGGYAQHFEEADSVYTYEEMVMFPSSHWLLNSIQDAEHMRRQLLVFDIDVHKAPDSFDVNRLSIPEDTPVVKSQSGGFHVYFVINQSHRGKDSDFELVADLPFDIDIRGEFVKHHVVAPSAVPGIENEYDLVNDTSIKHYFDPKEAARRIQLDGKPVLSYNPGRKSSGRNYNREEVDPPEEMPLCYGAGLELRAEAPDDPSLNTHKVNVLTALSGLAAGYDVETVVEDFVEEYYPGEPDQADEERTEYQVQHIAQKLDNGEYDPPAVSTLQEYSILPEDEWCTCGLPGHDKSTENQSGYYDVDLLTIANIHGLNGDPYEDRTALLRACLHAREEYDGLKDEKPPYAALVALGEEMGLAFEDEEEKILGESSYNVAKRVYSDLQPGEV